MNSDENKTIPTALNGFITSYNIDWGPMAAAAVLTIIPTLLMFAFASKYIVQGLTGGAVKGQIICHRVSAAAASATRPTE